MKIRLIWTWLTILTLESTIIMIVKSRYSRWLFGWNMRGKDTCRTGHVVRNRQYKRCIKFCMRGIQVSGTELYLQYFYSWWIKRGIIHYFMPCKMQYNCSQRHYWLVIRSYFKDEPVLHLCCVHYLSVIFFFFFFFFFGGGEQCMRDNGQEGRVVNQTWCKLKYVLLSVRTVGELLVN